MTALWRAACDPMVLSACAKTAADDDPDAFNLLSLPLAATIFRAGDGIEHVLVADGLRRIRFELHGARLADGPVHLHYDLSGIRRLDRNALLLQRLSALCRLHRFPRRLFPPDPIVARRVMALQALDAHRAGAGQRDIILAVLGPKMADERSFDSSRKKVARLLKRGHERVEAGYRQFLSIGNEGQR